MKIKKIVITLCAAVLLAASATAFAAPTQAPVKTTTTTTSVTKKGSVSSSSVSDTESDSSSNEVTGKSVSSSNSSSIRSNGSNSSDDNYDEEQNDSENVQDEEQQTAENSIQQPVPTPIAQAEQQQPEQSVAAQAAAQVTNGKKYTTKGGAFLWFLLSVIVNAILSFMIGNRFYNLARKEKNVGAEIKALRRDLEEKFVSNVGGFSEMETDVTNTNDNYSENGSISMPERSSVDFASESEDVFKRWDSKMNRTRRPASRVEAPVVDTEDEFEEEPKPRRTYQPSRRISKPEIEEDNYEDEDEVYEAEDTKFRSVKKKAKSFLGDIFPFKDEDEEFPDDED